MSGPYGDAALGYWDAGWRGVLPLPPRKKKNPPTGYTGEDGTDPSYADIHTWATGGEGEGNVALRMPRNIIGVDVDNYGEKLGAATLTSAEKLHGDLPATWRTTSRDDGISGIRLYRVPEGLAWPGEIGPGTELIQWRHRYAIVAPSIHPETGGTYRWINPAGLVSTTVPDPDELPTLPEAWVEHYTGGQLAGDTHRDTRDHANAALWVATLDGAGQTPCRRMGKVIEQARKDLLGSAHNAARDGALRAVRLGSEGHRGAVEALRQVRDMFILDATAPGRDLGGRHRRTAREADHEWGAILTSATNLVTANPSPDPTCDCEGQLTRRITGAAPGVLRTEGTSAIAPAPIDLRPEPRPAPAQPGTDARLVDGASFILDVPDTVPAVWGDKDGVLWAEGEALMLVGPPGVGKTTLTGQILAGLLYGKTVLGLPVRPAAKRILYLAMDRPQQIARSLARTFTEADRDALTDRVRIWQGPPPRDVARNPEILVALAALADADVIIIDSVKDAAIGLTEDEIGAGYNRARQTALAAGVQILELHHLVKRGPNGNKPNTLADVYGSVWLTAGAGSVVLLWGEAGDLVVEFVHLKQPAAEVGPWKVAHDHEAGHSAVLLGVDLIVVVAAAGPAGATIKVVACIEFETETPTANEIKRTQRRLEKLVRQGHLERSGGSRGGRDDTRNPAVYRTVSDSPKTIPNPIPTIPGTNPAVAPLKGRGPHAVPDNPGTAPDTRPRSGLLVACTRCFSPTPAEAADANDGQCEYCAHGRFQE